MVDPSLLTVTILSDTSLIFTEEHATAKGNKQKKHVRQDDIKEHLERMLPYDFHLMITGGTTMTQYVGT